MSFYLFHVIHSLHMSTSSASAFRFIPQWSKLFVHIHMYVFMYAYACAHIHTPISIQVHKHGRLWLRFHYVWWFICTNNKQSEHLGGPGHASDGAFLPGEILLKAIDFERPGGREWLPSGTPFQNFYTFFGRVFGPARVRISYAFSLRSDSFATSKKCAPVCAYKRANMLHGRRPHA